MFDNTESFENSKKFFLLLIVFSVFLLLSNLFFVKKNIVEFTNFLINPIQTTASNSSESVKGFFRVFPEVKTLRNEFNDLQEKYLKLQAESGALVLLKEENMTLKEQLGFEKNSEGLLLAEVLFQDLELQNESLLINKGFKDGVSQGDIVAVGEMYIGLIVEVSDFTSKVRLPTSRASSLKVMILNDEEEISKESFSPSNYFSGIAVGYSSTLKIENVETTGEFKEGLPIFVNDPKVGIFLYLGDILSVDKDPTLSLRSGTIRLPIEYSNLKYVFVRKEK